MRHTAEQTGVRYRVRDDIEGWPIIPGRLGTVEWGGDHSRLAVFTTRMRVLPRLLAIAGVRRWQTGDTEARVLFPPDPGILRAVCSVIRSRVRRLPSPNAAAALALARAARTGVDVV